MNLWLQCCDSRAGSDRGHKAATRIWPCNKFPYRAVKVHRWLWTIPSLVTPCLPVQRAVLPSSWNLNTGQILVCHPGLKQETHFGTVKRTPPPPPHLLLVSYLAALYHQQCTIRLICNCEKISVTQPPNSKQNMACMETGLWPVTPSHDGAEPDHVEDTVHAGSRFKHPWEFYFGFTYLRTVPFAPLNAGTVS